MDDLKIVGGGILSSAFHSLTGPDHLAALLPVIFCRRWYTAALYGIVWGAGHGLSSSIVGVMAASLKGSLLHDSAIEWLSSWSTVGIGVTLIVIGIMGLYELAHENEGMLKKTSLTLTDDASAREPRTCVAAIIAQPSWPPDTADSAKSPAGHCTGPGLGPGLDDPPGQEKEALLLLLDPEKASLDTLRCRSASAAELQSLVAEARLRTALDPFLLASLLTQFCNGFLLGMAIDVMPSVAPALSLQTSREVLAFFGAYTLGSLGTMGLIAGAIGESTSWLGTVVVSLPSRLALASSYCSLLIGCCWLVYASHAERVALLVLLVLSPCIVLLTLFAAVHPSPWATVSLVLRQHCHGCFGSRSGMFLSPKKHKVERV